MIWMGNIVVYATPFVALVAWLLILTSFLSPHPIELSPLLVIKPAVSSMSNLPAATFGLFGSCIQPNANSFPICSSIRDGGFSGLELFPNTTAKGLLTPLRLELKVFISISLGTSIFSSMYWLALVGLEWNGFDHTRASIVFQWVPCIAFMFGFLPFMGVYMLFRKTCDDFNLYNKLRPGGIQADDLVASMGNGFLAAWIGSGALFHSMTVLWVHLLDDYKKKP